MSVEVVQDWNLIHTVVVTIVVVADVVIAAIVVVVVWGGVGGGDKFGVVDLRNNITISIQREQTTIAEVWVWLDASA